MGSPEEVLKEETASSCDVENPTTGMARSDQEGTIAKDGGDINVAIISPSEGQRRYFNANTPGDVMRSKFVLAQLAFNIVASFLGPLGTFYLLFGYLSQGPYDWSSGALVGVVVGSLAGSPILIFALMPVGLPEAVEKGWFLRLQMHEEQPQESFPRWFRWLLPILKWRWSTARNLTLGLLVGVIYVPPALLIARFGLGPTLDTWTLIWFNVVYEVLLTIPIVAFGLLGYALEPNLEITLDRMSDHPNVVLRLLYRSLTSLRMAVWPY